MTRVSEPVVLRAVSRHTVGALRSARGHLREHALRLVLFGVLAFLPLRLVPSLAQALDDLERVSWLWLIAALAHETLSEIGVLLGLGIFAGENDLTLTILPAAVAGAGVVAAILYGAGRLAKAPGTECRIAAP
jgi:hypothetical protein